MSKLIASEQSLNSLRYLDKLYAEQQDEKYISILRSTSGEPLKRLIYAAVSRMKNYVFVISPDPYAGLTDLAINSNLSDDAEQVMTGMDAVGSDGTLQVILSHLIARFYAQEHK